MGLSRRAIPVFPVVPILTFPIAYYIDHFTSGSANFETVLSLLSSFLVPEDDDALLSWIEQMLGDQKLRSQIAQWRQDWVQFVVSGWDGDALYSVASVLSRIYFSRAAFVLIPVVFHTRLCALLSEHLYILRLRLYRGRCTHSSFNGTSRMQFYAQSLSSFL
jgi:hypothetical protein